MFNKEFSFLLNKTDKRYCTIWLAALNTREFQRIARIEDSEIERISIPSICDEIILKLSEESYLVVSTEDDNQKPMLSFLMASQLFIGLTYLHEQQVKFLCDFASRWTLPTKLLIEHEPQCEEDSPSPPSAKKALKRKSSSVKKRKSLKRKSSFVFDLPEEAEDIVTLNRTTAELLQNAFVSNNDDISIHETSLDYEANEVGVPTDVFDVQFNEVTVNPEPPNFDEDMLGDGLMSSLNQQQTVDETGVSLELPRHEHFNLSDDTVYGEAAELGNAESIIKEPGNTMIYDTMYEETAELGNTETVTEAPANTMNDEPTNNSMQMESIEENEIPNITNISTRKRKRNQPFKDRVLNIDVKQNMRTSSRTQRHSNPKDDSVSKSTRLNHLSREVFNIPSHVVSADNSVRQFELKHVSDKLMESFKRMTLTKTEETNHNLINEFCMNQSNVTLPEVTLENSEQSVIDVPVDAPHNSLGSEQSQSLQINYVAEASLTMPSIPEIPDLEEMLQESVAQPPNIYQHEVELLPVIRELLLTNQTSNPFIQCVTDSQKLFACRSRQNRLDWGTEGVLLKLMSLWNSGIYPIGMKEIMQQNTQRISAATAFFSVMELNSARIGLISIDKKPNSNNIFHIMKSPKLMELHGML